MLFKLPKCVFNDNHILKCKCKLEKCWTCPTVALNQQLYEKCNIGYYRM